MASRPRPRSRSTGHSEIPAFTARISIRWIDLSVTNADREHAALAAAASLYRRRFPELDDPDETHQEAVERISSFTSSAKTRFSALEAIKTRPEVLFFVGASDREISLSENDHVREIGDPGSSHEREVYGLVGRPGEGGRRQPNRKKLQTEETRKVLAALGQPLEQRTVAGNVTVIRWEVDPKGDSVWCIRLSPTQQEKSQETAMTQLHEMMALRDQGRLAQPRWIILTLNNSGARLPYERYDLMLVREGIEEGWLRRVVFRNEKRLARQKYTLSWCEQLFQSTGTEVFFTEYGKPVDWTSSNDRMLFTFKGMVASEERISIVQQTQAQLDRTWVQEGRGWPTLKLIGFKRDPLTEYLIEDEIQTEMIVRAAHLFVTTSGVKSGLAGVAKQMTEKYGFEVSTKQWERIFKEKGYSTGDFTFLRHGIPTAIKHIDLVHPISSALFQTLQNTFATNKGNTRSRSGDFVLLRAGNGQKLQPDECGVFCKTCGKKLGAWLQGEHNDTRYRHTSPVPKSCRCWGGIERGVIEAAVMPELWRLAEVKEFHEASVRAAALEEVAVSAYLTTAQRKQIEREVADLDREIARLGREYRRLYLHNNKAAGSRKNHIEAYNDLVSGLCEDKQHLQARLEQAEALEAVERSVPPSVDIGLAEALRAVLTIDVPEDNAACRLRAAVFGRVVTKIVVDKRDDGTWEIELHGPLIPADLPLLSVPNAVEFVRAELRGHQSEAPTTANGHHPKNGVFADARQDLSLRPDLQVTSQGSLYDVTCKSRYAWIISIIVPGSRVADASEDDQ